MTPSRPADPAAPAASDEAPLIELRGVSFQYRAQSAPTLHDIDLEIRRGEKIGIVGASGSGKSTLLALLNGLVPHRHRGRVTGLVRVCGIDPAEHPLIDTARRVGTVLQDSSGQFVGLTVAEDIAFSLENQQVPPAQMPERVRAAAALTGIEDRLDTAPQDLSGGQKQRVALAGVLVDEVDVLLFDEPLAMLDPASGRAAVELIDDLHRDSGRTVIVVEHRLEELLHRPLDRIVLMADGRIVADLPPDELIASGLLERHGIRPPLHVAALALAGTPVRAEQSPSDITTMRLDDAQIAAVRAWARGSESADERARSAVEGPGDSAAAAPERATAVPADAPPAVDLDAVTCKVPTGPDSSTEILRGVTASIARGEMIGILGSNGAGKSTLARLVCGFAPTSGGTVRIGGEDAATWPIAQRGEHVAYVLQEPGQMLSRPLIREEIALGLRARGLDDAEIERRTAHVLDVCGLAPFRTWPVSALSHGQKKRLTIAIALALEPDVLILDEPTAGQDFAHYTEFMDTLAALNAQGVTIVLVTHDMHLALEYTSRVLVVSEGRILADAPPSAVLTDPEITTEADLVTTGLFTLAQRCGVADADALVRRFVADDRAARKGEAR